jgi:hypothetical protein
MQDALQDVAFCSAPESKVFASLTVAQYAVSCLVSLILFLQNGGAYIMLQWSIADLEQLLEDLSGLKHSACRHPPAPSTSPAQRVSHPPPPTTTASLSKSASEKLEYICSELGRPLPAVAAIGSTSAIAGEEMLGRRRSAQVAESTFPRKVNWNM